MSCLENYKMGIDLILKSFLFQICINRNSLNLVDLSAYDLILVLILIDEYSNVYAHFKFDEYKCKDSYLKKVTQFMRLPSIGAWGGRCSLNPTSRQAVSRI